MTTRSLRSLCVFCGARSGDHPDYLNAARELGTLLAKEAITLVYGGGHLGMMGALADATLAANGRVIGVIPRKLVAKEAAHQGLTELILTDSMQERKERMISLSDGFVGLPGGLGTYDELFETLTLAQLGMHDKPNAVYNVRGYFDPLIALVRETVRRDFAAPQHERLLIVEPASLETMLDAMRRW